jgi:uncharacterized 2Fe-2S/4Fe-4S cluster protein (DUF4445 family)
VAGKTIFDYADELEVEVATSCLRSGECHECVVEITQGMEALVERTENERYLRGDYRLACQARVVRDSPSISFSPLRRRPRILETSGYDHGRPAEFHPAVTRSGNQVKYGDTVVDRYRRSICGLAIDLGTTTVVVELVDLETGETLGVASFENPQKFGGSDVMHRISYEARPGVAGELRKAVVAAINQATRDLCRRAGRRAPTVYEIVVAANSTMRDILFGLSVQSIGEMPYKSLIEHEYLAGYRPHTALVADTRSLGLRANRQAKVYGIPLVASHVGADAVACLETVRLGEEGRTEMLVDMGTNTEVLLSHEGRMWAASCPAGPAFEGGLVTYGMRAYAGAIESIRLSADGTASFHRTIGDEPALGICGSGLVDLLAELRRRGLMTERGAFPHDRKLSAIDVVPERGITFSREDASNLAQAKAANYCGQFIVMRNAGVQPADLDRLYLAGGFATYLDVVNATEIGLIAPVSEERVVKVGNAAVEGARALLLSEQRRRWAEGVHKGVTHIELETTPDFFDIFVEGCQLKPMPATFAEMQAPAQLVSI